MIHATKLSQGLGRIRKQFLARLFDRREQILWNTLRAGEANTFAERQTYLAAVRDILHQIAGTAGTLGFPDFGASARRIENNIDEFLGEFDESPVPPELLRDLVGFADVAHEIIEAG